MDSQNDESINLSLIKWSEQMGESIKYRNACNYRIDVEAADYVYDLVL